MPKTKKAKTNKNRERFFNLLRAACRDMDKTTLILALEFERLPKDGLRRHDLKNLVADLNKARDLTAKVLNQTLNGGYLNH